jgi:hypothetical protein
MKYYVDHTCGHKVEHLLFGPTKDRDRKLEWLATQPCIDCKKESDLRAAQDVADQNGLPKLTGSEKQVAWAEKLRAQVWQSLQELEKREAKPEESTDWIEWLFSHAEAKWWIETPKRQFDPSDLPTWFRWFITGQYDTSWKTYYHAYADRLRQEAEDDLKRERVAWEKHVLDALRARESVKVWTSGQDPDDRRIYRDGDLIYDREGPGEGWSDEAVALMVELCRKWKTLRIHRPR